MKRYIHLIVAISLSALALLSGCRHTPDGRLLHAESIMEQHPDSALMILEAMQLPDNAPEGDRALYALLLTHARYKNFIDEDNDSLVRTAADYFIDEGNAEEASRALFLTGMIQMNAGRLGEAAVSFSKGLDIARENQCFLWEGQCAIGLVLLYGNLLDSSAQLKYANEAYEAFSKGGHEDWIDWSRLDMAIAYNNYGQYERAYSIAEEIAGKSKIAHDSVLLEESLLLMGKSQYNLGNHYESIGCYAAAYSLNHKILTQPDKKNVSYSASKIKIDSVSSSVKEFIGNIASMDGCNKSFTTLADLGKYEEAYRNLKLYKNRQDSIIALILQNNVSESVNRYEDNKDKLEHERQHSERVMAFAIIVTFFMIAAISFLIFKVQLHKKEARIAGLIVNIDNLKKDLELQLDKNRGHDEPDSYLSGKPYSQILKETYAEANDLCDRYYQCANLKSFNKGSSEEIERIIRNFTDPEYLGKIEEHVDGISDNLYSSFKKEMHYIKEENRRLFLYYLLGFSPRSISIFMNLKISAIYNKKSRLRSAISSSNASRKDEYLNVIR